MIDRQEQLKFIRSSYLRWTIRSPARLHLGLLEICPGQPNQFGGIGFSIDEPATLLSGQTFRRDGQPSPHWQMENATLWQERGEFVCKRASHHGGNVDANSATLSPEETVGRIRVDCPPKAHSGLGSGTQFACSVASLVSAMQCFSIPECSTYTANDVWQHVASKGDRSAISQLAWTTDRGKRSHIGLATHLRAGFLFDHGIPEPSQIDRTIERISVPEQWHVVLARPLSSTSISGKTEVDYFAKCERKNMHRDRMLELIYQEIFPSIKLANLERLGAAIFEYGKLGGEIFREVQGGIYRDASVAELVNTIKNSGSKATGQTSWGPTVYSIVNDLHEAQSLVQLLQKRFENHIATQITRLTNQPATLTVHCDETSMEEL